MTLKLKEINFPAQEAGRFVDTSKGGLWEAR